MEILGNIVAISVENVRTSEDAALSAERMQAWHGVSAAAAHRLGNILPYTEARLKDARNGRGDVKELLSLCYEDIRSAMRILADFKTFARPPEIRPVPISLRELFGTVSELSRAEGVETEIDWPEGDCRLVLDPFAMKLIFLNLITNTREAKPNKPKARLSAEISEDSVRIAYCDNGPGIPEQEKSKILSHSSQKGEGNWIGAHNRKEGC
jgi:nitrogen fixation/metabolism regulation signal transduction histidine kinase